MRKTLGNCITGWFCLVSSCGICAAQATGKADTQAWQKPTLVTLHLHDVSAQQALESVEQQTGLKLQVQNKLAADRLMLTPVNIEAVDQPFWAVMEKICEAADVVPQSATGQGAGFVFGVERGGWSAPFVSVQGPFAVALIRVVQNASIRFGESDPPLPGAVSLALQICPEPKVPVLTVNHIHITKCVDETGFPVAADEQRSFQIFGWPSQQSVDLRPTGSARIALIEGEVSVNVESGRQPLEISNIMTARDVVRMVEGFRIRLNQCLKQGARGRQFVLQFLVLKEAHSDGELKQFVDRLLRSRPELLDGEGKNLTPEIAQNASRPTADGFQLRISFNRGLGPEPSTGVPLKLAWDVPTGSAAVSIPFSFKDVPLPTSKATLLAKNAPAATMPAVEVVSERVDYSKRVDELVRKLGAAPSQQREDTLIGLSLLPPEAFGQIEAAAKRSDLPAGAKQLLNSFVIRGRPLLQARLRRWQVLKQGMQWDERTALEAYSRFGVRDPRWDQLARQAMHLYCESEENTPTQARIALEKLIEAGCTDPMLLSIAAYVFERSGYEPHELLRLYQKAHQGIQSSHYPAYRKIWTTIRYFSLLHRTASADLHFQKGNRFDSETGSRLGRLQREALILWPQTARDGAPDERLVAVALRIVSIHYSAGQPIEPVYKAIAPPLDQVLAGKPGPLVVKGSFFADFAWEARGNGTADTVTAEGWKLMHERLAVANESLQKAYSLDSTDPRAAATMLRVELGQGSGPEVMDRWFGRAMSADPDNMMACGAKLYYLEPKWYGSPQEMLKFANQCFDSGAWRGKIPTLLADAHLRLSAYEPDAAVYLGRQDVWRDIQRVYEPYLRVVPDDVELRSQYCAYACRAAKWDVARAQFEILGPRIVPLSFESGGMDQINVFRRKAASAIKPTGGL